MSNKNKLITIASRLLTQQLSDCEEDYTFKIPKHMIRKIERHNDMLRRTAIELRGMYDEQ